MIKKTVSIMAVLLSLAAALWIVDAHGLNASPVAAPTDHSKDACQLLHRQKPMSAVRAWHLRMQSWRCAQQSN